jgi:PAS domain S-box-containing protein
MIWVSGPDKQRHWFNRTWLQFVGQPLEHECGAGWLESVHPDDRADCLRTYHTSCDAREPFEMEYRLLRHDREPRWVLDTGAPNVGADGVFDGYLGSCVDVTEQKRAVQRADQSREHLHTETVYLRREVKDLRRGRPAGRSAAMERVMAMIDQVAPTNSTVLLLGETGTGKEYLASRVHDLSDRRARSMVRVNCAAIPAALIESELFGRERGAFTGASTRQSGRFEIADRSTIFLDEIGDLPLDVQVKLLRVLEERQFERLGSSTPVKVDARIIAATHRNLEQRISDGTFREDLFYRLNVFPIVVPPLRERADDIPSLVWYFVDQFSASLDRRFESIPEDNMTAIQAYSWPGNIRELRNVVERAMILATGETLTIALPESPGAPNPPPRRSSASAKLEDIERDHIRRVLEAAGWRIRGVGGAADRLGLAPTTLESRMIKLGLSRPGSAN